MKKPRIKDIYTYERLELEHSEILENIKNKYKGDPVEAITREYRLFAFIEECYYNLENIFDNGDCIISIKNEFIEPDVNILLTLAEHWSEFDSPSFNCDDFYNVLDCFDESLELIYGEFMNYTIEVLNKEYNVIYDEILLGNKKCTKEFLDNNAKKIVFLNEIKETLGAALSNNTININFNNPDGKINVLSGILDHCIRADSNDNYYDEIMFGLDYVLTGTEN